MHREPVAGALYTAYHGVRVDRGVEGARVVAEVVDELAGGHEAVRIRPGVPPARQPAQPVRREETEAVPAGGPPAFADAPPVQDHMPDVAIGQTAAHREAGVAGADHDRVGGRHGRQLVETSIDTGTPLVSTSYTAERDRDCSTRPRRTSSGASPEIWNVTRMPW